jgi:hypothetical protein
VFGFVSTGTATRPATAIQLLRQKDGSGGPRTVGPGASSQVKSMTLPSDVLGVIAAHGDTEHDIWALLSSFPSTPALREQAIRQWSGTTRAAERLQLGAEDREPRQGETWEGWLCRQTRRFESPPATPRRFESPPPAPGRGSRRAYRSLCADDAHEKVIPTQLNLMG